MAESWIADADERMKAKGSKGSFGRATKKKIAAGKKTGGKRAKKAQFAETMKKLASKRKKKGRKGGRGM